MKYGADGNRWQEYIACHIIFARGDATHEFNMRIQQ